MTTKPQKEKTLTPGPKLVPRQTAASIARAALKTNKVTPPPQRPAPKTLVGSPPARKKASFSRNLPNTDTNLDTKIQEPVKTIVSDTKPDVHLDTKVQELVATTNNDPKIDTTLEAKVQEPVTIIDTRTDEGKVIEETIDEIVREQENPSISEVLPEEADKLKEIEDQLDVIVPLDCSESLIDSIDMASTPSLSQPQTPVASRPTTPKNRALSKPLETRCNTPYSTVSSGHATSPCSRPTTPKRKSFVFEDEVKTTFSEKQTQFLQMKKELDMKQQAVLEAFDNLRSLRERLPQEAATGGGEGAMQELLVFNVADWPAEELAQLYRDVSGSDTDGTMQLIESISIDEANLNEVEARVTKIPEQFAELCLQAFTARQELIDWIKDLMNSGNMQYCGEGETVQKITNYNSQGLQLCEALRELKEQADSAVDTVSYITKRIWRDQNALINVGKSLVRDVAQLKQDLASQATVIKEMQQAHIHRLQVENSTLEETRHELQEERAAKNQLKEKLANSDAQNRQNRTRITKMDRQLREAEASISTLTGTVKVLEDQSRQKEVQLEARARKMRESLKTGEVASGHLAHQRDALQAEVTELKDQIEKLTTQFSTTIKDLERQLKETKSALDAQICLNSKKDLDLASSKDTALEESRDTVEKFKAKIAELQNIIAKNDGQKNSPAREMELMAELQATKDALRMVEEEIIVFKQEKVRFLETLAKIAESDTKVGMQQKLAAELLSKEEIIGKMQAQMRELVKNDKLLEQKVIQYEQYIHNLPINETGHQRNEDSQKEILELKMKLLEEIHRNEQLTQTIADRDRKLDQQDKTSRAQARVIKVREELINMLKNKETEQTRELLELQQDLENRMKIVDEVNKQIAAKAVEIQELFSTLEGKQQQIHRLEKIVLALEEQQRRSQAQRTRHEEKIAALEHELAAGGGCRRDRKFLFF